MFTVAALSGENVDNMPADGINCHRLNRFSQCATVLVVRHIAIAASPSAREIAPPMGKRCKISRRRLR
jgi:hypothetical protein